MRCVPPPPTRQSFLVATPGGGWTQPPPGLSDGDPTVRRCQRSYKGDHDHHKGAIVDGVDDPEVADTNTQTRPPLQCVGGRRVRVFRQERDHTVQPTSHRLVELVQGTNSGGAQLNAILLPLNVRAFLVHRCVEGGDVLKSELGGSNTSPSSLAVETVGKNVGRIQRLRRRSEWTRSQCNSEAARS